MCQKKAILVVSFGTSFHETRRKNIDAIEQAICEDYPEYSHYSAWTSQRIIEKLYTRDQITILSVSDAMRKMAVDGITDVIIQPTHMIDGIENNQMKKDALVFQDSFDSLVFGEPLLSSRDDKERVLQAIVSSFKTRSPEEVLLLIGHGSAHEANAAYDSIHTILQDNEYPNTILGTIEDKSSIDLLIDTLKKSNAKKVILIPFMIVAGNHAVKHIAGIEKDSWKSRFEAAGFEVTYLPKGLGEYLQIREIFVEHIAQAKNQEISD